LNLIIAPKKNEGKEKGKNLALRCRVKLQTVCYES